MKILITGGHVTPALAVIEELKKHPNVDIVFVGKKYTSVKKKTLSFEYQVIADLKISFIHLETGRLTRLFSLSSFLNLLRLPFGLIRSFYIIQKEKPDITFSFGGYIAFPLVISSFLLGVRIFTHEQTMIPGISNRFIAYLSKKIFISFPETKGFFDKKKTVVTGNPLRKSIFHVIKKPFLIEKTKPVIYITGGSLGSHSINRMIEEVFPDLLKKYIIIHQTGNREEYGDFDRLSRHKDKNYFLRAHFTSEEIGFVYSVSDMVIARSGANTIFELIALKKPAILIPLPWSAGGEQRAHALILQKKGVAEIFSQEKDSTKILLSLVKKILNNKDTYIKNYSYIQHYFFPYASKKIVDFILS